MTGRALSLSELNDTFAAPAASFQHGQGIFSPGMAVEARRAAAPAFAGPAVTTGARMHKAAGPTNNASPRAPNFT